MSTPIISVIVPVYNGEKYIETFMKCVENQSFDSYEVLFIDDGSKDNTLAVCNAISEENDKVRVIHKENGGPSSARNLGIKEAKGEYLVFFDIDDEFDERVLEDNYDIAVNKNSDIVIWNFRMVLDWKSGKDREIVRHVGGSFAGDANDFFYECLIPILDNEMFNPPWNKMIKRDFLVENDLLFNENYSIYEDILFSYNIVEKASRIAINDKVYYSYIIKKAGSLLTKLHKECFDVIQEIYMAAMRYGKPFDHNENQIFRFKKQFLHLTKGHIKQICMDKKLTFRQKKDYLSDIGDNTTYRQLCISYGLEGKSAIASKMMIYHLYGLIIVYYHLLSCFRSIPVIQK